MVSIRVAAGADVPAAFDDAAPGYDLMVRLNPGYHRHLRAAAQAFLPLARGRTRLVDLGCGSGASTRALLDVLGDCEIVGVDASAGMLAQARRKDWPSGVRFVHGPAESLGTARADWDLAEPVGGILAAYLFRNVDDRESVLAAAYQVLAPGAPLVVQEYSVAGSWRARLVWTLVCWLVVIPLGWLTSRQTRLYRYLWRSVLQFDTVEEFADRLRRAGFVDVEVDQVGGWQRGILHTFRCRRPE